MMQAQPTACKALLTLKAPAVNFDTATWYSSIVCQAPKNTIYTDLIQEFDHFVAHEGCTQRIREWFGLEETLMII